MASTPEGKVKDKIKKLLAEYGAYVVMPVAGSGGRVGVADFIVCCRGYFLAIEAKATAKNGPTKIQLHEHKKVAAAGGQVMVIHEGNLDDLRAALHRIYCL